MLDTILNAAKDYVQGAVVDHPDVPNHQNSAVSDAIMSSLGGVLKNQLGGGQSGLGGIDLGQLGSLLGGGGNNSALNSTIANAIAQKTGINPQVAQGVVSSVLPGVINAVTGKIAGGAASKSGGGNILGNLAGSVLGNLLGK